MSVRSSAYAGASLMRYGQFPFLAETPAGRPASDTVSQLAAAGRRPFPGPYFDLQAIEREAREMRAQALAGAIVRFFRWLVESAERARYREVERYLAKSVDLIDVERRLRNLERSRHPMFGSY